MEMKKMLCMAIIYLVAGLIAYIMYTVYYVGLYVRTAYNDEAKGDEILKRLEALGELAGRYGINRKYIVAYVLLTVIKITIIWPYYVACTISVMQKYVFYDV